MPRHGKAPGRKGSKGPTTTSVSVSWEKTDKILMSGVILLCVCVAGIVCDADWLIVSLLCVFTVAGVIGNAMLIDRAFQRNEKGLQRCCSCSSSASPCTSYLRCSELDLELGPESVQGG